MPTVFRLLNATSLFSCLLIASTAQADLRVSFDEGAPKDRFRIENIGLCAVSNASVMVDLSTSQGGLIFDVTSQGEGVEVFQPFELVEGAKALGGVPIVTDGQTEVRLDIVSLAPSEAIAFTIDVDDTRGQRAITVSGSEIEGAVVSYSDAQAKESAMFSTLSEAEVRLPNC